MAAHRPSVAITFVYLLLSGPHAASARRSYDVASFSREAATSASAEDVGGNTALASTLEQEAQWCNPFSSQSTKHYKLEVLESGENCSVGVCTAYEFVRRKQISGLKVYHGQSWAVKSAVKDDAYADVDELSWTLVQSNKVEPAWDEEFKVMEADYISMGEANAKRGLREYVYFKFGDKEIKISGGMFYQNDVVKRGIDKIQKGDIGNEGAQEHATHSTHAAGKNGVRSDSIVAHDSKIGRNVAGGIGFTSVVGFWVAATVQGIAVSNTALLSAALAASIGGAVAGAVLGAGIGAIAGIAGVVGIVKLMRDKGLSGAEKLWEKLYCMDFKVCHTRVKKEGQYVTTYTTKGKRCPPRTG